MKHVVLLGFILVLFSCGPLEISIINSYTKHEAPEALTRATASSFVIGHNAYVIFGRNEGIYNDLWQLNSQTGDWVQLNDFPGKARVGAVASVVGNHAYVGLGYAGVHNIDMYSDSMYLKDFWKYYPTDDTWTRLADFPGIGRTGAVSIVHESEIYVFNGFINGPSNREVWKYNPANDEWTRMNDYPSRHRYATVACTDGKRIFAGTGFNTLNNNTWLEYIPSSDSWIKRKDMPDTGRINAVAFCVEGRFFVATGRYYGGHLTGGHLKQDVVEYLPASDSWIRHTDFPGLPRENAVAFVINKRVYIGLGEDNTTIFNDFWSFTPAIPAP
jgi:N-acetylneuraminic acid mutarotase